MNEKIREFSLKAKAEHCISHVRLEEFAELIIKECAEIASQCAEWAVQNPEDHLLKRFDLYKTPAEIKKNFGIKE